MTTSTIEQDIARTVHDILGGEYEVFLFGSRATDEATERSDYDIGIKGPCPIPLGTLGELQEALDALPTLAKIEIVDFERTSDSFLNVAQQTARPLRS